MTTIPEIPTFLGGRAVVDGRGYPQPDFLRALNAIAALVKAIASIPAIQDALSDLETATAAAQAAADAAQTAADNANAAADAASSESSIVSSFPTNFTPPLIQADSTGNVTIANHDRQYGNATLNPTVAVTGNSIATGGTAGQVIRVYYDDPTRAGGAVTYQFTVDPADPPVQGGDRHVVGAVTIPGAGTQSGNGVRPPGYVEP